MDILGVNFKSANYEGQNLKIELHFSIIIQQYLTTLGCQKIHCINSMSALHSKLEKSKHVNLAEHFCKGCLGWQKAQHFLKSTLGFVIGPGMFLLVVSHLL